MFEIKKIYCRTPVVYAFKIQTHQVVHTIVLLYIRKSNYKYLPTD